jgi:hypothetical protein
MIKVGLISFLIFAVVLPEVAAQKLKYKDIFGLLSTKQYDQAEPFLKKYLRENDDNPNAFLNMGIIYHEKSSKLDILKQKALVFKNIDSALFFYDRARRTIDEREIKKNSEYYQSYNRRDLRTGEFGVKISDIQFDLDKRMEGLRERRDRIKMTHYYFSFADSLYKKCNSLYRSIQHSYQSINELYLRSSDSTLTKLNALAVRFDSTLKVAENYVASVQNVGGIDDKCSLMLDEIHDLKKDGIELSDMYQRDLHLWDYKKFAVHAKEIIEGEIIPLREHLLSFDAELNKLAIKLKSDSASVKSELTKLTEKLLSAQLKKYDEDPLPLNVFRIKMADLEYQSTLIENKLLRDSSDVHLQLMLSSAEMKNLNVLDSLSQKLLSSDLETSVADFDHFVTNAYGSPVVLKTFIKGVKESAEREKIRLEERLAREKNALNWLVVDSTSVPLTMDSIFFGYQPLVVVGERYTVGLAYADSSNVSGYFFSITPSRVPDVRVRFPVDNLSFARRHVADLRSITTDASNQIYYVLVYSEKVMNEKYPTTLAKIYRSDGLSWSNNFELDFAPSAIEYRQDTGDLVISAADKVLIVDKNGKSK